MNILEVPSSEAHAKKSREVLLLGTLFLLPAALMIVSPALAAMPVSAQVIPSTNTALPGDTINVAVAVSNSGTSTAQGISVKMIVPKGWTWAPSDSGPISLSPNQTGLWEFSIAVPSGSTATGSTSQFTIIAIVNSTIGTAVGTASIQVSPANLALPDGNIPVSLLAVLVPGLLSIAIFSWISGVKLGVDWRTAILSFLLGSLVWFLSPVPFGETGPLEWNVFSPALQLGVPDLESVALWTVVVGVVPAIAFSVLNWLLPIVEARLEDELRKVRLPQVQQTDALGYALTRAVKKSYKKSHRAMAALEVVAGSPPVTVSGLLKAFDDVAPYDLVLVPRYTIQMTNDEFKEAKAKIPFWSYRLKSRIAGLSPADLKKLLPPADLIALTAMVGDKVRSDKASKTKRLIPPSGENIETVVKGSDIHRIEVVDYVAPYSIIIKDGGKDSTVLP